MNHTELIKEEMERRRITAYRVSREMEDTMPVVVMRWIKGFTKPAMESEKRIEAWLEKSKRLN